MQIRILCDAVSAVTSSVKSWHRTLQTGLGSAQCGRRADTLPGKGAESC